MTSEATTIDMNASYRVRGYSGVAFYLLGYATTWTEEEYIFCGEGDEDDPDNYLYNEPEEIEDRSFVRAVMVGDDRVHLVDVDDLTVLPREDYCGQCGQIGCTHDGYDREEN